jgi:hypothetical protein
MGEEKAATNGTAVTGAGVVHLAGLKTLRSLTIVRCGMDDAGVE